LQISLTDDLNYIAKCVIFLFCFVLFQESDYADLIDFLKAVVFLAPLLYFCVDQDNRIIANHTLLNLTSDFIHSRLFRTGHVLIEITVKSIVHQLPRHEGYIPEI